MKATLIPESPCISRQRERGITMVLVALAMVAIIGIAALSIDVISLYLVKEEAQRAADAAALTAARVISIAGLTSDPGKTAWGPICGLTGGIEGAATQAAKAIASQNAMGGTAAAPPVVTYSDGGAGVTDCTALAVSGHFSVNPRVTVQVRRAGLPNFFSRIWGTTGNTVSATATAEAFNPSASDFASGTVTPVQPSCVKPLMVPNQDPNNPLCSGGSGGSCPQFVNTTNGSIMNPGFRSATNTTGVIGETFTLLADCSGFGGPCTLATPQPQANVPAGTANGNPAPPNLEYLAGEAPGSAVALPACTVAGAGGNPLYPAAVSGCDQSTAYQCGVQSSIASPANIIDLSENPAGPPPTGDTASAVACLLVNDSTAAVPLTGQDTLTVDPLTITAGSAYPNALLQGKQVSSSNSIMSFPIYDTTNPLVFTGTRANVTIVGFLQVFVNDVTADGSLNVTILNVSGCGTSAANAPIPGTSPVPVRLVTPP